MHTLETNRFLLPQTGQMDFVINYIRTTHLNQNEPHIHRECEIYVNLSGDVSFEVEGRIYPVRRGSVIITRPYEYHHCILHSSAEHAHYWITFSAPRDDPALKNFFQREKGYNNHILLSEDLLEAFQQAAAVLLQNDIDLLEQRIGVLQILDILRKGMKTQPVGNMQNLPQDVIAALLYMDEHLTEDVDMRLLAKNCGVSINTLERHFKDALRALPTQILRKKRLFASMVCLRQGKTVADAAIESGFSDYSHYIQLFKKQFGITPLQYRKNFQTK